MAAIGKRLLNVLALLCTAYLLVLIFIMATSGVSNWYEFVSVNFGFLVGCYALIAGVNYIAFGKPTLWHKNPTGTK